MKMIKLKWYGSKRGDIRLKMHPITPRHQPQNNIVNSRYLKVEVHPEQLISESKFPGPKVQFLVPEHLL